jgi:hypothetical protein
MDILPVVLTTFGGALSATLGVVVGGAVTRRSQERHWLRDRQLTAYEELFGQYSRFMMELRRAHLDRRPYETVGRHQEGHGPAGKTRPGRDPA